MTTAEQTGLEWAHQLDGDTPKWTATFTTSEGHYEAEVWREKPGVFRYEITPFRRGIPRPPVHGLFTEVERAKRAAEEWIEENA